MIFRYHLRIGKVWTIRNEIAYPIHGKYPQCPYFLTFLLRLFLRERGNRK